MNIVLKLLEQNQNEVICRLQRGDPCSKRDSIDKITLKKWKNIEGQSKKWTGLDILESVFTTADWNLGPTGLSMHDSCYIKLCSPRKLTQAEKRKQKQLQHIVSEDESGFKSNTAVTDNSFSSLPNERTHTVGIVHDKTNIFDVSRDHIKSTQTISVPNYTLFLNSEHGHLSSAMPFYQKMMKFKCALQV